MQVDKISANPNGGNRDQMEPPSMVDKILELSSFGWGKSCQSLLIFSHSSFKDTFQFFLLIKEILAPKPTKT